MTGWNLLALAVMLFAAVLFALAAIGHQLAASRFRRATELFDAVREGSGLLPGVVPADAILPPAGTTSSSGSVADPNGRGSRRPWREHQ